MKSFQEILLSLIGYWADKGCLFQQGYDCEKGAGTFNIDTFFRVLGPEPYNVVNVELCRRPADGRNGDSPNRFQKFHQVQVIMKPAPSDIISLYLQSLEAIGLNLSEHDIRLVHDDWNAPTQGASGVGWEVWCDGMEITQFTYFQTMAGFDLSPISVELAYGIERIAMFLQNKKSVYDVMYNDKLTYRDVYLQSEKEWCRYNFDIADTDLLFAHFDNYEKEALSLANQSLPYPAFDYVLKASHLFNMLEARGAISVTERTSYIHKIRHLSCEVAKAYQEERKNLQYPLLKEVKEEPKKADDKSPIHPHYSHERREDCLIELGSEELPDSYINGAIASFERALRKLLQELHLPFEDTQIFATPRRLAILIKKLAEGTEDKYVEKRGPPLSIAFNEDGIATKAGVGFFTSVGLPMQNRAAIEAGEIKELSIKDGEYLYATVLEKGESTFSILHRKLPEIIEEIPFPKKMYWTEDKTPYARPLRWILALYGKEVIPITYANVHSSAVTFGHRQRAPKQIELRHPREYVEKLKKAFVIADSLERKIFINSQLNEIEQETGCRALSRDLVLGQVVHLSEYPTLAAHEFDKKYLDLPPEVIMSEMTNHQRLFPCSDKSGKLSNLFIATLDQETSDIILNNNTAVLTARLEDGAFTYHQDIKQSLEYFNEKLQKVTFQKQLGSVYDKVLRIKKHASYLTKYIEPPVDESLLMRAAELCKADLASSMVAEFPELQGTIGNHYAMYHKEPLDVAIAIEEHWKPAHEHDSLPSSTISQLLSLSDKLDNLLGYFLVGLRASSSKDPYALRRSALGMIRILIDKRISMHLPTVLSELLNHFSSAPIENPDPLLTQKDLISFLSSRLKTSLADYDFEKKEIEAILTDGCTDPYDQYCKVKALHEYRKAHQEFDHLKEVYKRVNGQTENHPAKAFKQDLLTHEDEIALHEALSEKKGALDVALKERNYIQAFDSLAALQAPLNRFFENVKVLDDNQGVQDNRIALLQDVSAYFQKLLDFSKL